jgi:hypothetical protein
MRSRLAGLACDFLHFFFFHGRGCERDSSTRRWRLHSILSSFFALLSFSTPLLPHFIGWDLAQGTHAVLCCSVLLAGCERAMRLMQEAFSCASYGVIALELDSAWSSRSRSCLSARCVSECGQQTHDTHSLFFPNVPQPSCSHRIGDGGCRNRRRCDWGWTHWSWRGISLAPAQASELVSFRKCF